MQKALLKNKIRQLVYRPKKQSKIEMLYERTKIKPITEKKE